MATPPEMLRQSLHLARFTLPHLPDLRKRRGLPRAWPVGPPPPFARVGEGLSRNTPTGAQLALIFRGARERKGAAAPFHPRLKGGTPPLQNPPELHVLEQGRAEKGPLFSEGACNLAIGANGECFRPSLCLEWLPQVQGPKMTSKLVCGV